MNFNPFKLSNGSLLKKGLQNSAIYSSASAIATLINFAAFIYYSRILGPEQYGEYNIVVSFISIISIFSFSGINKVILREASLYEDNISKVYNESYFIRLLFIIVALIICSIALLFTGYSRQVNIYILVFSGSLLVQSFNLSINSVIQAKLKYKLISIFILVEALALFGVAVVLLYLDFNVLALIISQLSVPLILALFKYLYLNKNYGFKIEFHRKFNKEYFSQGLNFSVLNNLSVLSSKVDIFMLSFLTTEYMVGIYSVAFNLVSKIGVLRNSVVLSFFPITAKKINTSGISKRTLIKYSVIISAPVFLGAYILNFFAEDLIVLLVGEKFALSADFLVLLIYRVGLDFMVLPIGIALQASYNEKVNLIFAGLRAFFNIFLNFVFFHIWGVIGIAYSTLITTLIVSLFMLFYGYRRLVKLKLIH